jgi:predicted transcriptional regulator
MPRSCSICCHPQRDGIDAALVAARPKRQIASECGVTEASVRRHAASHLPKSLIKAATAREAVRVDDMLGLAQRLQREALEVLERAKEAGNLGGVLQAIDRLQKGVVLLTSVRETQGSAAPMNFAELAQRARGQTQQEQPSHMSAPAESGGGV